MSRGQAALEFLLTYSWSIMVVLTMFGLFIYFGVIEPRAFVPNSCIAGTGIICSGNALITPSEVSFTLTNNLETTLVLDTTQFIIPQSCTDIYICDFGDTTCTDTTKQILNRESFTITASCTNHKYFEGDFVFPYTNINNGLPDSLTVKLIGNVND